MMVGSNLTFYWCLGEVVTKVSEKFSTHELKDRTEVVYGHWPASSVYLEDREEWFMYVNGKNGCKVENVPEFVLITRMLV